MKAKLTLNSPTITARRKAISQAVALAAATLERLIKEKIAASIPAGRTYRRSAITTRISKRTAAAGFRTKGNRAVVGFNFHRASARGQPPAILTGRLINSIRARQLAEFRYRVGTSVVYAIYLDSPEALDRPFFISVAVEFRPVFLEMIRKAFIEGK